MWPVVGVPVEPVDLVDPGWCLWQVVGLQQRSFFHQKDDSMTGPLWVNSSGWV